MNRALKDFVGVAGASVIATGVDGLAFWQLSALGVRVGVAAVLAAILGGVLHFSLCRWGVFRRTDANLMRSIPLYVMMSGFAALLQGAAVELGALFMAPGLAWLVAKILIYTGWTFPVSRYVVFKGAKQ